MPQTHARTCHICEANCGILLEIEGRKVRSIKGNPDHVLSRGYICPKATAIPDIQEDPDRLRNPLKKKGEGWEKISWQDAYREIAARLAGVTSGPKVPALYLGNPNTHNYSVTTQMRGFIKALGNKGIYSASTLDQLPHMLAQRWIYGHNALYPVPDIDRTQYMVIVGGNPLASNGSLWTCPDIRGRLRALLARGGKAVVIDPRRTETAKAASAHHFIQPGTDTGFLLGLLKCLDEEDFVAPGRLEDILDEGWAKIWTEIGALDLDVLSGYCGISVDIMREIARELGSGAPAIVYGRMGTSVTRFGTVNKWLIQLLNIATGNLDREGGTMFPAPVIDPVENSGTGAYGRYYTRVKGSPEVLGELPAAELATEIATPGEGQIGALFTIAGNPVLSTPGGRQLDAALAQLDLMVSIDMYINETTRHADYILPPCGPLEKDHYPLLLAPIAARNFAAYSPALFEKAEGSKSDWEIMRDLTQAIGAANGRHMPAALSPRDALAMMLENSAYDISLEALEAAPNGIDFGPLKPHLPGRLKTEDGKIHCAPAPLMQDFEAVREAIKKSVFPRFSLIGRRHARDNNSWLHNSNRLIKGPNRCTLMISAQDANALDLQEGDKAKVYNDIGCVEIDIEITEDVMPGIVSIPHGYGHNRGQTFWKVADAHPGVSINDLTDPTQIDVLSGNAVLNGIPVEIEKCA